ncbi:MAG: radical SAM protein [Desulfurococcales archaeon ex4484_204]|nr:MAG: radical SAM protein [Desulfurococcales archaeon ex4484_204]
MGVRKVFVKSVLNRHRRDRWFLDEYSVNPYYGCPFNCVYCYTHGGRYGVRGGLAVKVNAPAVLDRELWRRGRRGEYGFIALSSATEPWGLGVEDRYGVTRRCLRVILRHRFPVHCLTKSTLITRDLDILAELRGRARLPADLQGVVRDGILITFSLSTLRDEVAEVFEPRAPPPRERLNTLARVREEGFTAGISYIPVLPFITDSEVEEMARVAKDLGADYVFFAPLTLEGREVYLRVLESRYPELVARYEELYRGRTPLKQYVARFYREVLKHLERYGLRFGITEVDLGV